MPPLRCVLFLVHPWYAFRGASYRCIGNRHTPFLMRGTFPMVKRGIKRHPMSFEAKCPYCGAKYEATEQDMNRNFSCEICGKDFVVQSVGGTQARPTPQTGSQGKVVIKPRRNTAKGRAVSIKPPQTAESSRPPFRVLHEPVTPLSQKLPSQTQERKLFDVFVDVFIDVYDAAVNWFRNSLWPCILIVAIVPTVFWLHYVNHLRKGEASAICPICWFTGSEEFKAVRQIRQKQKEIDALKARRAELEGKEAKWDKDENGGSSLPHVEEETRYETVFVMLDRYHYPDDNGFTMAFENKTRLKPYFTDCPHCGNPCDKGHRSLPKQNAETKALIKYIFICPWCHLKFHNTQFRDNQRGEN